MLEFSNHHQRNLQSEHTASQFRPAHLLTLAPAELRVLLSMCLCACGCLCGPVCAQLPLEIWVTRHWALHKGGVNLSGAWGDRTHAYVPCLFHEHICKLFFFYTKDTLHKMLTEQTWECTWACMRAQLRFRHNSTWYARICTLMGDYCSRETAQISWSGFWTHVHHTEVNLYTYVIRTV